MLPARLAGASKNRGAGTCIAGAGHQGSANVDYTHANLYRHRPFCTAAWIDAVIMYADVLL